MTGKTHEAGGVLCSIVGFAILQKEGLLLPDMNEALQWLVMYPFCIWGSVASDLDHNPDSIPKKDIASKIINKILHITHPYVKFVEEHTTERERKINLAYRGAKFLDAKHRSWQTHSDLTLWILFILLKLIKNGSFTFMSQVDISVTSLILMAIMTGIAMHFILDMLTPEGVWITLFVIINRILKLLSPKLAFLPEKLHFVPHTKSKFFATGNQWEEFIRNRVLKVATWVATVWFLGHFLYPIVAEYIPYEITFFN